MAWNKKANTSAFSENFIANLVGTMQSIAVLLFVVLLSACGDDGGNNVSLQNDSEEFPKQEVSSVDELGPCDETNVSASFFVVTENAFYICDGVRWQKTYFELSSSSNEILQIGDFDYDRLSSRLEYNSSSADFPLSSVDLARSSSSKVVKSSSSVRSSSSAKTSSSSKKIEQSSSTTIKSSSSKNLNLGAFIDSRDGKTYKTVVIGSQTWMAENLSYQIENSFCYENNEDNCNKYGRLYTLDSAIYVCPNGWHLPTMTEWQALCSLDGASVAGKNLKTKAGWNKNGGADSYGFSALPAGHGLISTKGSLGYGGIGSEADFWVIPEMKDYFIELKGDDDAARKTYIADANSMVYIRSVRCLKGKNTYKSVSSSSQRNGLSSSNAMSKSSSSEKKLSSSSKQSEPVTGYMMDPRDGTTYKTVVIGDNIWMAENLNYKTMRSSCHAVGHGYAVADCPMYGRLYPWEDAKNACPKGWSLPTKTLFEQLIDFVGGESVAGKALKSSSGWNGLDTYSFAALPGGIIDAGGSSGKGERAYFWSRTAYYGLLLSGTSDAAYLIDKQKDYELSIRCVKDYR